MISDERTIDFEWEWDRGALREKSSECAIL